MSIIFRHKKPKRKLCSSPLWTISSRSKPSYFWRVTIKFFFFFFRNRLAIAHCDISSSNQEKNNPKLLKWISPTEETILEITKPIQFSNLSKKVSNTSIQFEKIHKMYANGTYALFEEKSTFKLNSAGIYEISRKNFGSYNLKINMFQNGYFKFVLFNQTSSQFIHSLTETQMDLSFSITEYDKIINNSALLNCTPFSPCNIVIRKRDWIRNNNNKNFSRKKVVILNITKTH